MIEQNVAIIKDKVTAKSDSYLDTITDYVQSLVNNPDVAIRASDSNKYAEQLLEHISENGAMTTPTSGLIGKRFSSSLYNDIIRDADIDLKAFYNRLSSLTNYINNISSVINSKIYTDLSTIDKLLDKIANLSNLKDTYNQYDDVTYNTFIDNINTHNIVDQQTNHGESGGIITLSDTITDEIVETERNYDIFAMPLNTSATYDIVNNKATSDEITDSLDISVYSKNPLFVNEYQIALQEDGVTKSVITYNGCTVAIIIRLAALKFINNISMKFASAGLTEVQGVYYTDQAASNIMDFHWVDTEFEVDKNNIRGVDVNFPTKEAQSIMMVLGLKQSKELSIEADRGLDSLVRKNEYHLSELNDTLSEIYNTASFGTLKRYLKPSVVDTLSDSTAAVTNRLIETIESMLPNNSDQSETYNTILDYNFCIYDLKVKYIHYFNNSTYKSRFIGGLGDTLSYLLTTTDYEAYENTLFGKSIDTTVNYFLELQNGYHRILPSGEEYAKDVFTVTEAGSNQSFYFDLYASSETINVYINNEEEATDNYSIIKQYSGSTVGIGITITRDLNPGDTIMTIYQISSTTPDNKVYNPNEINLDDAVGNPVLIDSRLNKCNKDRVLVHNDSDEYISFERPTEIFIGKLPPEDPPSGSVSLLEEQSDEAILAYQIVSGSVSNTERKMTIDDLPGDYGDDWVSGSSSGIIVKEHHIIAPSSAIYMGIIDETPSGSGAPYEFNTGYGYVPGTLHAFVGNEEININEYSTDEFSSIHDKNVFDTNGIDYASGTPSQPASGMTVSYIPIDLDSATDDIQSNISAHNFKQAFYGTDENAVIQLPISPHLDKSIIESAYSPGTEWVESKGVFINLFNEKVTYEPIKIEIDGRRVENLTNFEGTNEKNPEFTEFNPISENYQYYIDHDKIVFNTVISGKLINISCYKQSDTTRVVAKLYRTNRKVDDITPEVYGYALYRNKRE